MTNTWTISLFAGLAERLNTRTLFLEWEQTELKAGQVKQRLANLFPEHADLLSVCFMAQNQVYAHDEAIVKFSDELALLPPVSGGTDEAQDDTKELHEGKRYMISDDPIDVNSVLSRVYHPDHGAAIAFVGTTREWTAGKRTVTLEYEAYVPMAESALAQIGEEISARWPGTLCAITHRIGTVGIGEISVVIAISSSHRSEAYEASRYAIERLKQTVPIWKKEIYEDGTEWKGHQLGPWDPIASLDGSGGEKR
ncbi:molybdenum cofactor biosynthesis protein MoaE [Cohnella silvisoli]|uniref:Molybdenum cofactor biosynthesis protein MoaE n=1 Tax=Cohnella silvisoli TaxID=2873699 RepID=A0ABV1KTT9_9BACL|nr:molybdenum cofactor biosynthesis protein MoaE [Cohnella silvisoli]MCD9022799.1 molybdenum cofactor biosynthesis protein MoaE [Cohnella silvisoli]